MSMGIFNTKDTLKEDATEGELGFPDLSLYHCEYLLTFSKKMW